MFDDDFWWKLNEDDDENEFVKSLKSGGARYKSKSNKTTQNSQQQKKSKIIPVVCNVQGVNSLFDKTKTGGILCSLCVILSFLAYISLLLTIIFAIREMLIFILFGVLFIAIMFSLIIISSLRAKLNKEYKQSLINEHKKKNKTKK